MNVFPFGPPILEKIYVSLSRKVIFDIEDNILSPEVGSINKIASILTQVFHMKILLAEQTLSP